MLQNFFQLNPQSTPMNGVQVETHFRSSTDLRSVLYNPDVWPEPTAISLRSVKSKTFTNVSLSKTDFSNTTFTECTFTDCLFIGCTFRSVDFHRCKFKDCNFYKSSFDNCYIDPHAFEFNKIYKATHSNVGVGLYQQLLENSSKQRQSAFSRKSDIEFRRWKRSQLIYDQRKQRITAGQRVRYQFLSSLYDVVAGYGYSPSKFILSTIFLFVLFSLLNMIIIPGHVKIDGDIQQSVSFTDSVFYTYSMLTALGFSSIVPVSAVGKLLAVVLALFGIGWLGIFTSLLVNRFTK